MKRFSYFWIALGMAFLLLLPIYSMAQTKLILESESGDRIGTPRIKSFALGEDNTLVIYLAEAFSFVSLIPDITVDNSPNSYSGCTVTKPASVTATQGATIKFKLYSETLNTTFRMVVSPEPDIATFNQNEFSWNTGGTNPVQNGSYLAVFEAIAGTLKSQLVVMIKIGSSVQYTLTALANPTAGGTVSGGGTYSAGTQAQVTATGSSGYTFSSWIEGTSPLGTSNPITITMNTNRTITANFTSQGQYTLQVNVNPAGGGTVTKSPDKTSYSSGETVVLTANAGSGYTFGSWTEGTSPLGTSNPITITMNTNRTITANFTGTNMTGKWATQVASATKLNALLSGYVNTYGVSGIGINRYEKKYFLVDPKAFNIPFSGSGWTHFEIRDLMQGAYINIYYPTVYKIDANASELSWRNMVGGDVFVRDIEFSRTEYEGGIRFLIELEEKGTGSTSSGLTVFWVFR